MHDASWKAILYYSFFSDALTLATRLRSPGVWIPVIFHVDLLTNEAMFTGWNPTGTEARLFTYKGTTFGAAGAQLTLKLFPSSKLRILCLKCFSSWRRRLSYTVVLTVYVLLMGVRNFRNTVGLLWPKWKNSSKNK